MKNSVDTRVMLTKTSILTAEGFVKVIAKLPMLMILPNLSQKLTKWTSLLFYTIIKMLFLLISSNIEIQLLSEYVCGVPYQLLLNLGSNGQT